MSGKPERQELSLADATQHLLEEARMVLPGMQALFGFQLIAVFNTGFSEKLSVVEQRLHVTAIALVAIAIATIMTPAAYHRQHSPRSVSAHFIRVSSRLLLWSMVPLAIAIAIDFSLIVAIVVGRAASHWLGVALFAVYMVFWFMIPRLMKRRGAG